MSNTTISRTEAVSLIEEIGRVGGRRLLVTGEAGMGKSTLIHDAAARLETMGARVLRASPSFAERYTTYSTLWDLLTTLDADAVSSVHDDYRVILDIALGRRLAEGELPALATAVALEGILGDLSATRPLVLLVDDLQWADAESAAAVERAVRRSTHRPVSVIATTREHPIGSSTSLGLTFGIDEERMLDGLTVEELETLTQSAWPTTMTRSQVAALRDHTAGNPMWALELVERGVVGDLGALQVGALQAPRSLATSIAERLGSMSPDASDAVSIVALLGRPTLELVTDVLDFSGTPTGSMEEAEAAGFLSVTTSAVRTRHPLHASAAVARLVPARRRELHAFIARAVDDVIVRAQHLQQSRPPGPDETVATALAKAAADLRRRGARLRSAHFDAQSVERTDPDDPRFPERLLNQAQQLFSAGDHEACIRALTRVSVSGLDTHQFDAFLALSVSCRMAAGGSRQTGLLLDGQAAGLRPTHRRRAIIDANRAAFAPMTARDRERLAESSADALIGTHAPNAVHRALRASVSARLGLGLGIDVGRIADMDRRQAVEIVAGLEDTGLAAIASSGYVIDDVSTSRRAFAELAEWARSEGKEGIERVFLGQAALVELVADDGPAARALFERARWSPTSTSLPRALRSAAGHLLIAEGRHDDLAVLCSSPDGEDDFADEAEACETHALSGLSAVAQGRWEDVVPHLEAAAALADREGLIELGARLRIDLPLAEALLHTGGLSEARRRLSGVRDFLREHERPISEITLRRVQSLESASRGDLAEALAHADTAVGLAADLGRPTDEASALLQRARVNRRLRRVGRSRADVLTADDRARRSGNAAVRDQVERELLSSRGTRGPNELTPSEQRVLEVLRSGRSNREIAAALFVSVRTVESHVAAILRKTGVSTRSKLITRRSD